MQDSDGWTPLHAAAHWEQAEAVDLMYKLGANFLVENNSRQLPVDILPVEDEYCRPNKVFKLVQKYTDEAKRKLKEKEELEEKEKLKKEEELKKAKERFEKEKERF